MIATRSFMANSGIPFPRPQGTRGPIPDHFTVKTLHVISEF